MNVKTFKQSSLVLDIPSSSHLHVIVPLLKNIANKITAHHFLPKPIHCMTLNKKVNLMTSITRKSMLKLAVQSRFKRVCQKLTTWGATEKLENKRQVYDKGPPTPPASYRIVSVFFYYPGCLIHMCSGLQFWSLAVQLILMGLLLIGCNCSVH